MLSNLGQQLRIGPGSLKLSTWKQVNLLLEKQSASWKPTCTIWGGWSLVWIGRIEIWERINHVLWGPFSQGWVPKPLCILPKDPNSSSHKLFLPPRSKHRWTGSDPSLDRAIDLDLKVVYNHSPSVSVTDKLIRAVEAKAVGKIELNRCIIMIIKFQNWMLCE